MKTYYWWENKTEHFAEAASRSNIRNSSVRRCRIGSVKSKEEPYWYKVFLSHHECAAMEYVKMKRGKDA